jgi:hypothetical protein
MKRARFFELLDFEVQVVFSHPPIKTAAHSKKKGKTLSLVDYLMRFSCADEHKSDLVSIVLGLTMEDVHIVKRCSKDMLVTPGHRWSRAEVQEFFPHPPVKTAAYSKKKGKPLFLLDYLMRFSWVEEHKSGIIRVV